MPRADPVLIFDLDGTILRRNSFPYWVLALLSGSGQGSLHTRLPLSWHVQSLLIRRKLGRIDHDTFLRALQRLWNETGATNGRPADRLQARLERLVRGNMTLLLRDVAGGALDAVLATAAAAEYAEPLARELGFRYVLATSCDTRHPTNRGTHKSERVLAFLDSMGWASRPRIFFNDHMDDLPLMQQSQAVCWFGRPRALAAARIAAPDARFVAASTLSATELQQMLAHLGQSLAAAQLTRTASLDRAPRASTFS